MTYRFNNISGKANDIIETLMSSSAMPSNESLLLKVRLCIEESVTNIVEYAYPDGDGWLEGTVENENGILSITLRDGGIHFDPLVREDPDITLSAEDRPIGGLGIYICKKIMDTLTYSWVDGCNILTMTINE